MSLVAFLAQTATNAAAAVPDAAAQTPERPFWTNIPLFLLMIAGFYFVLIRPTQLAQKKQTETVKSAKTGDKIITTGGIHGVITNVKETSVIVKVYDNVKLEIEKNHIDKITRPGSETEKDTVVKA
jgi:preprotein translocase subunit YajC